ncbi:MAG: hypothetical protein MI923_00735 [Phycisphaerales bacterium]|nr:hypothetical protein [Phycisphaerales bacterium]
MRLRLIASTGIFFLNVLTAAEAATINVPADQPTIQQAIDAAVNGDEVVIAPGTYLEHIDLLGKAITLRSTDPNDPAVVAATIIDGGNDPNAPGFPQNVGTTVACRTSEGPDTVLLGLTVTGGAASAGNGLAAGGGIGMFQANPTVTNCRFVNNSVADLTANGGGIYCGFGGPLTFTGCEFIGNSARNGGGLSVANQAVSVIDCVFRENTSLGDDVFPGHGAGLFIGNSSASVISVTGCMFEDNTATGSGGGAWLNSSDDGVVNVINCDFINNNAMEGDGAGAWISDGEVMVTDCLLRGNSAGDAGGGMSIVFSLSLNISQCMFENNSTDSSGGGLRVFAPDASTIGNCQFSGNTAMNAGGAMSLGGVDRTHLVTSCTFDNNEAFGLGGGGAFCVQSAFEFDDCTFTNNHATESGGGALISNAGPVTMMNSSFELNSADDDGGGMSIFSGDTFSVRDCDFIGNTAGPGGGGGLDIGNHTSVMSEVVGCTFLNNTSTGEGGGAGLFNGETVQHVNCVFQQNTATQGGGVYDAFAEDTRYTNCLFIQNDAPDGAAMAFACATSTVTNCTFTENTVPTTGGVFYLTCSDPLGDVIATRNSIIWGNTAAPAEIVANMTLDIEHSDIEGGQGAVIVGLGALNYGPGNIDVDPVFEDPDGPDDDPNTLADNDYRLGLGSPCIDAANSSASVLPFGLTTDLDDGPRIVNALNYADTGIPNGMGLVVDMGAYEAAPDLCFVGDADGDGTCDGQDVCPNRKPGDVNGDGATDTDDITSFVSVVLDPGAAIADDLCAADVNEDGNADGLDVQDFADRLINGPPPPGTGACCICCPVDPCVEGVTELHCLGLLGGHYQGDGTTCNDPCPVGACCFDGGLCIELTSIACELADAVFQGDGTVCEIDPPTCPEP